MKINNKLLATSIVATAILLLAISAASVTAQAGNPINIEILESLGGTTNPGPGTYAYNDGEVYSITAIPAEGFVFDHWVLTGDIPGGQQQLEVTDNPVTGDCGYGYSYQFQAVFAPVSAAAAPMTIAVEYVALIVGVAIVACAAVAISAFRAGKKQAN